MKRFVGALFFLIFTPLIGSAKPIEALISDCSSAQYQDRSALEAYAQKNPKSPKAAQAIYCVGDVSKKKYLKTKDKASLKSALTAYERVARKYSGSPYAADSLLALGDLRRIGLKDEVAARAAYFEVIDRYPKSAAEAKKRLNPTKPEKKVEKVEKIEVAAATKAPTPSPTEKPVKTEPVQDILIEKPVAAATPAAPKSEGSTKIGALPPAAATQDPDLINTPSPGSGKVLVLDESIIPKRPLVVIDPGHGGEDHGAKGVDGILEKNVVLDVAKELELLLKDRLRAKTFLTRTTDVFIALPDRTKLANDRNADLFISIHANASEYRTASGIETYYLDNTNEKSSLKLADRENASLNFGPKGHSDLGFIFSDLIQNVKLADSIALAHNLQDSMASTLSRYYQGVNNLGVKKAPFYVLVGAHMPCILTEISFVDHPMEGKRLGEERYQKLIAQSLYEGIRRFFIKREVRH